MGISEIHNNWRSQFSKIKPSNVANKKEQLNELISKSCNNLFWKLVQYSQLVQQKEKGTISPFTDIDEVLKSQKDSLKDSLQVYIKSVLQYLSETPEKSDKSNQIKDNLREEFNSVIKDFAGNSLETIVQKAFLEPEIQGYISKLSNRVIFQTEKGNIEKIQLFPEPLSSDILESPMSHGLIIQDDNIPTKTPLAAAPDKPDLVLSDKDKAPTSTIEKVNYGRFKN